MTGARRLINQLVKRNVTDIFGYPGGAILPVLNELHQHKKIKYYLSRTEQGAGFMADGYAKISGKMGVVMTTSGPGALNIMTCLQNALSDGTPMIALTGQVSTAVLGTDAFQEANIIDVSKTCTKWNSMIRDGGLIENTVDAAVDAIFDKRHGPVLLDLPKNIMSESVKSYMVERSWRPGDWSVEPLIKSTVCVDDILKMIESAKRPVILAGQGVLQAGPKAINHLRMLSMIYNIPVTTTLMGLGVFNEKKKLSLKMVGMHGSFYANRAVQNCDLLLNFGSRFDDRIIGLPSKFASFAKIVHVDISAKNINKVIKTPYYINDSCAPVLAELISKSVDSASTASDFIKNRRYNNDQWITSIDGWKAVPFSYPKHTGILQGREVIATLNTLMYSDAWANTHFTIVADVGAHQMWAAQFIDYNYYRVRFLTSGGLGSMGYALPASIGAKIALTSSNNKVICICGDGGFTMSFVELLTAIENKVNIKVLIINNSYQLMVKMWQDKFYDKRYVGVKMNNPPFELVCREMGCKTMKIDGVKDIDKKLQEFLEYEDGPIIANVITNQSEAVLPMVSPGKALDDMILFESEDKLEGDAPC